MGNALWTGVRLKDVLDRAGVKSGAVQVRFTGLDQPLVAGAPLRWTARGLGGRLPRLGGGRARGHSQ